MEARIKSNTDRKVAGRAEDILPERFLKVARRKGAHLDLDLAALAYEFSAAKHRGQKRASGEDYVDHCVEVAAVIAEIPLDSVSVAAALLHDSVEDTDATLKEVDQEFGREIATIVEGLTKISRVELGSFAERQVATYRKLLLSMARDARVIPIKLADRLHNMRTLEHKQKGSRARIALETREIYAPLAHRLGMARIKWELEDLAFKFLEPDAYDDLASKVNSTRTEREAQIQQLESVLKEELSQAGLDCEVTGRPKHLWSIYGKMLLRDKTFEEIYDTLAIRVLVDSVKDCYHALGVVHTKWTPLTERFHDFIATPKSNMYQSLHTTVFGPGGQLFEVQIRTHEMHRTSEYGIAAHWRYKGRGRKDDLDEKLSWLGQVLDWQKEPVDPEEFMEFLRIDLFQDEIFVFTPAGDVKQLPKEATPIDFAFAVHTEVGMRCSGAMVNDRIAPLSRRLRSGDTVKIQTSKNQAPSRDWLGFVKTSKARHKIKQWVKKVERESSLQVGREVVEREWRRAGKGKLREKHATALARQMGYDQVEGLYAAVGKGDVTLGKVAAAMKSPEEKGARRGPGDQNRGRQPGSLSNLVGKVWPGGADRGIQIQGLERLMVRYSQCCQPVPGDEVIGYITKGRGISIHRNDCPNVLRLADGPERRVDVDWGTTDERRFMVRVVMEGTDRPGLFADIAKSVSDTKTNIQSADIKAVEGGMTGQFVVEVEDLSHLRKVMKQIRRVKGVLSVERKESFGQTDMTLE